MATKTFSGNVGSSAIALGNTRSLTVYGSGSVYNQIDSASVTLYMSAGYWGTYTVQVTVSDGSNSISKTNVISVQSNRLSETFVLPNAGNINWNSTYLTLSAVCTAASGGSSVSRNTIYWLDTQTVSVNSTYIDTGGGDSGGSGGDGGSGSGSTVTASSIALSTTSATVGTNVSVNITPVDSSNYHIVRWYIGSNLISGPTTLSAGTTSSSVTITASHMAYIPSSTSGILVCNVQTYSSDGSSAGYAAAQCTLNVPGSYVPSFDIALNSANLKDGIYYQNIAKPGVSISSISAGSGASLSSYTVECTGMSNVTINNNNSSASYVYTTAISVTGNCTLSVTVTDSRGRTTTKSLTFTVIGYSSPTVSNYDTYRCTSAGVSTSNGNCLHVTVTNAKVGNTSDSSMKLTSIVVRYKLSTSSNYDGVALSITNINSQTYTLDRTITSPTFSVDNNYDIRIDITDTFGATVYLYDKIFKFGGVLFDICGVSGNEAVGIGEPVTGISGMNQRLVINGNWDIWYKGGDIASYFLKVSDIIGNVGSVRKIYYGPSAPSNPETGSIWIKQV